MLGVEGKQEAMGGGGGLPLFHMCCKVRPRDQDLTTVMNGPMNLAAGMCLGIGGVPSVLQVPELS